MNNKITTRLQHKLEKHKIISLNKKICDEKICDEKICDENKINRHLLKNNSICDFFIINIKERIDRYNNCVEQFDKFNINLHFMDAFTEDTDGRIGCAKSHLYLINYAKKNNMKYIIVVEDDFIMNNCIENNEFMEIITMLINNYNKYYIFNGSPTFWDYRNCLDKIKKKKSFDDKYYFINFGQKTTFIAYSSLIYDKMLEGYSPTVSNLHIDQYIAYNIKQLVYYQYICYELPSFSNVSKRPIDNMDYIKKEENFYKKISVIE